MLRPAAGPVVRPRSRTRPWLSATDNTMDRRSHSAGIQRSIDDCLAAPRDRPRHRCGCRSLVERASRQTPRERTRNPDTGGVGTSHRRRPCPGSRASASRPDKRPTQRPTPIPYTRVFLRLRWARRFSAARIGPTFNRRGHRNDAAWRIPRRELRLVQPRPEASLRTARPRLARHENDGQRREWHKYGRHRSNTLLRTLHHSVRRP